MAERLIAPVLKTGVPARVPWVQIPPRPPLWYEYNMASASHRLLQIAIMIGSMVPVLAGLVGILLGPEMVNMAASPTMDSHYRYLSGLLLGIGLGFLSCIPSIVNKTARFQLLASIVVVGGLGRLFSLIVAGTPNKQMLFGLGMELAVTPLLALWQWRIAHPKKK